MNNSYDENIYSKKINGHPLCLFYMRAFNLFKNFIEMSKNVIYVYECKFLAKEKTANLKNNLIPRGTYSCR